MPPATLALRIRRIYPSDMKLFPVRSILIVAALVGILVLLAVLQFEWVNEVAQAERDRMEASLETAIVRFRWDFYTQLRHVCSAFQVEQNGPARDILQAYADRYEDWIHASTRPRLVAGLWVWQARNHSGRRLFRLNPDTGKFEPSTWPRPFETLHAHLRHNPARFFQYAGPVEPPRRWSIVEQVPALVHAFRIPEVDALPGRASPSRADWVIIELNLKYMETALFPLLTERYFHGPTGFIYRVSVLSQEHPGKSIYESAPALPGSSGYPPDATADLIPVHHLDLLESPFPAGLTERSGPTGSADLPGSPDSRPESHGVDPVILLAGQKADWQVVVRHRSGSLQAAVMDLRRRDLAVSLGVLAVLAVSMGLIIVSAQRAQRLARLQMDFVAGISHELRTPLAVIRSAADNLADGVVGGGEQVQEYGALISNEGRRLTEMVEQTLGFAAQQAGRPSGERVAVDLARVIDAAVAQAGPMIESAGIQMEKYVQPDLPLVMGDAPALTRCVQNLLINAVKYRGESRWLRISTRAAHGRKRPEVETIVDDKGMGIEAGDIPHIFEPFYRGRSRGIAEIHGTGLGLSLAKDIAEAMGGSLSVRSEPGKGSSFTLRLPAASDSPARSEAVSQDQDRGDAAGK